MGVLRGAVLFAFVATACIGGGGGGGADEDGDGGTTVITFLTGQAETARLEAEAEEEIEIFEEQNPDIDVERESLPPDEVRTVIQTRLRSDNPPDVFTFDTGPGFGGVLADAGLLHPLEEAYEKYDWQIYEWAKQRATYDATVYGVPSQVEELGVYYNIDLFEDLGLEEPQTLEEFEAVAEAVKKEGLVPLAFGDSEQWPAGHLFSMAVSNLLGREGLDAILYGNDRWDSPEVVRGIDLFFSEFVEKGYYPQDVNALTYEDANNLFYAGEAAMAPTGTWLVSEIDEKVQDFEVGFFPFPAIDETGTNPPAGVGSGWFVAKNTDDPEAAMELLNFFNSQETGQRSAEKFSLIPAYPIDTEELDASPLFRSVLEDLSESPETGSFGYNIDVLTPVQFNDVMFNGFQEVLGGERTPDEQAEALQAAWAEAKKAGDILEKP